MTDQTKPIGQILYELVNPAFITVVRVEDHFRQHPFRVPNPKHTVPWSLLTERCKAGWERSAEGHHLLTEHRRAARNQQGHPS